ncbi:hypothetical protein ACHHYP_09597 [Achlya hypogyna]|uniref:FYVE-type domain-containing protein n=1 Tax=Achlya hypogyna TaxID=1202772 RepID=A0A1V9YMV8_ACHHY|nr:hypothetical protein ACHHYP_09597 [Achlya hypogyna]
MHRSPFLSLRSMASSTESDDDGLPVDGSDEVLLDPNRFVQPFAQPWDSARKQCLVCAREFTLWRKKHTCRMCGDVVCGRCSMHKRVDLPLIENKFRVCTCCFFAYRQVAKGGRTARAWNSLSDDDIRADLLTVDTNLHKGVEPKVLYEPTAYYSPTVLYDPADAVRPPSEECDDCSDGSMSFEEMLDAEDAALTARELELEAQVQASRLRVQELESKIMAQEAKHDLTRQQQLELQEARKLIVDLQRQLTAQEEQVQLRMTFRESVVLEPSPLRMRRPSGPSPQQRLKEDLQLTTDTAKLRRRLQKMERQLKQAGINVAEDIPYEEAKEKVEEISRRLQEIGSAEVVLADKAEQAALRKEYFRLEQDMERYNTALMMSDEYLEAEREKERRWQAAHAAENAASLRLVRSCVPVDVAVLSEASLAATLGPALAKKLKRTNVLALVRVAPAALARMHPSVVEAYRLTGLSVLERRALHAALEAPAADWAKLAQNDDLAARKLAWFQKLRDALVAALAALDAHAGDGHDCGRLCPRRAEAATHALYVPPTPPCPDGAVFYVTEVVKSDPDGAGEKAVAEARAHAVADRRQQQARAHYGVKQLRLATQAVGAMEELDAAIARMRTAEVALVAAHRGDLDRWATLLQDARDVVHSMARRSGLHLSGKRDPTKDAADARCVAEAQLAADVLSFVDGLLDEMDLALLLEPASAARARVVTLITATRELSTELTLRNRAVAQDYVPAVERSTWKALVGAAMPETLPVSVATPPVAATPTPPRAAVSFLDEIKAKKATTRAPVDMLAAIKARRHSKSSVPTSA